MGAAHFTQSKYTMQIKYSLIFIRTLSTCLLLIACVGSLPQYVSAEGSKELVSSGGDRAFLDYSDAVQVGIVRRTLIKVFMNAGETLSVGSSANGIGNSSITVTNPQGIKSVSTGVGGAGVIFSNTEEMAGPLPASGGYKPFVVVADVSGVFYVDFRGPVPSNTAGGNNYKANQSWTRAVDQPKDQAQVLAWDATVRSATGAIIKGRVYTNALAATMRGGGRAFSSLLYVLVKDGWVYSMDGNNMDPFGFIFLSNNRGNQLLGSEESSYRSEEQDKVNIYNPDFADSTSTITHKIFFNPPSRDLPKEARSIRGLEWLAPNPEASTFSNFTFTGLEGTLGKAGVGMGGMFAFTSNVLGRYTIALDVNSNNSMADAVDVTLVGDIQYGKNKVAWDGKDGQGAVVSAGTLAARSASLQATYGEVHFPLYDAEGNPNGFILTRLNGPEAPDAKIYWDDRLFKDTTSFIDTQDGRAGIVSTLGAHKWKSAGGGKGGDIRVMDSWSFVRHPKIYLDAPIAVRESRLSVKNHTISPATLALGGDALFTSDIVNTGPTDAADVSIQNIFPVGMVGTPRFSCTTLAGGVCGSFSIVGDAVVGTASLTKGSSVRLNIKVTLPSDAVPKAITNIVTVIREKDSYDPVTTDNTSTITFARSDAVVEVIAEAAKSTTTKTTVKGPVLIVDEQLGDTAPLPVATSTATVIKSVATNTPATKTSATTTPATSTSTTVSITTPVSAVTPFAIPTVTEERAATVTLLSTLKKEELKRDIRLLLRSTEDPQLKDSVDDYVHTPLDCTPFIQKPVLKTSSAQDINDLKKLLNSLSTTTSLKLNGIYDAALVSAVKAYQNRDIHQLTILKASGAKRAPGIADSYTITQLNMDYCYINVKNRCPYFYDYLTVGDANNTQNKLQNSTTTQVDVWKEFLNIMFPSMRLQYNGTYDEAMKKAVGEYQKTYRRTILSPWKTANPKASVTFYLREASRNWGNYMVKCPEGPIELYDGSGDIDYR
jgi:large repetitive protein